jgi:hypothetical protein
MSCQRDITKALDHDAKVAAIVARLGFRTRGGWLYGKQTSRT